ncbi:hypothetical protein [Desulfoluna sp.]|uniref:hypothetical protein n=1 Tax=Desulfoluna sp. TaxID=2045199 RepID=UPI0026066FD4|nr:hypothetical protein [Desulfoluna sp.]
MNGKRLATIMVLFVSSMLLSGCASTWVQKDPDWMNKKNVPVLVGHYSVSSDGGADVIDLAKQVAGGHSFGDVGMDTYKEMKKALAPFGFDLKTDQRRAKKLEHMKDLKTGSSKVDALLDSLTCEWHHPATANREFHHIMAGTSLRKTVVNKMKGSNKKEAFLSAHLKIEDQDQYLLFKRYRVVLGIQILDQKGDAIFQAKAEGFTGLSFLRNPWDEKRIQKALATALSTMQTVEVKPKVSRFSSL